MSIKLPEFLKDLEGINEFPVGFVARFEPHHKSYFTEQSPIDYLLIRIDDAKRMYAEIVKRPGIDVVLKKEAQKRIKEIEK